MDVDLGVDAGALRQAGDHGAEAAVLEADHRQGRVLDFDVRVVEVRPAAADLVDLAHEPLQEIELVGRLVDQHAAAFAGPLAAPGIRLVIRLITPAEHRKDAERRRADLTCLDCRLHAQHRLV